MNYVKILSVKPIGKKNTIDLEVDSEDHNFFCNGVCVSNSHSICYASLASKTIFLKFKYPQEFFCSILELAEFEQEPLKVIAEIEREIQGFGIKLLPPRLDRSQMDFSIEGKDIRYGLKSIKGVSDKTKEAIKSFAKYAPKNKYEVFLLAKEYGINIGVLTALIYAGALGEENRLRIALEAQVFNVLTDREKRNFCLLAEEYSYDLLASILDVKASGRIGDDNKPIMKPSRFDTFYKKYTPYKNLYQENKRHELLAIWLFEKKLIGYSFSHPLRSCFQENGAVPLKDVDKMENWRIIGFVEDVAIRTSQRQNRYMSLVVSDESSEKTFIFSDSPRENKLSDWLEDNIIKKEDLVELTGNKNFIATIRVIPNTIYLKLKDVKND